jgi:hypothetical protein
VHTAFKHALVSDEWKARKARLIEDLRSGSEELAGYMDKEKTLRRLQSQILQNEADHTKTLSQFAEDERMLRSDLAHCEGTHADLMHSLSLDFESLRSQQIAAERAITAQDIRRAKAAGDRVLQKLMGGLRKGIAALRQHLTRKPKHESEAFAIACGHVETNHQAETKRARTMLDARIEELKTIIGRAAECGCDGTAKIIAQIEAQTSKDNDVLRACLTRTGRRIAERTIELFAVNDRSWTSDGLVCDCAKELDVAHAKNARMLSEYLDKQTGDVVVAARAETRVIDLFVRKGNVMVDLIKRVYRDRISGESLEYTKTKLKRPRRLSNSEVTDTFAMGRFQREFYRLLPGGCPPELVRPKRKLKTAEEMETHHRHRHGRGMHHPQTGSSHHRHHRSRASAKGERGEGEAADYYDSDYEGYSRSSSAGEEEKAEQTGEVTSVPPERASGNSSASSVSGDEHKPHRHRARQSAGHNSEVEDENESPGISIALSFPPAGGSASQRKTPHFGHDRPHRRGNRRHGSFATAALDGSNKRFAFSPRAFAPPMKLEDPGHPPPNSILFAVISATGSSGAEQAFVLTKGESTPVKLSSSTNALPNTTASFVIAAAEADDDESSQRRLIGRHAAEWLPSSRLSLQGEKQATSLPSFPSSMHTHHHKLPAILVADREIAKLIKTPLSRRRMVKFFQ